MKNGREAIVVADGNDPGDRLTQLFHPHGLIVDQLDQIYVADCENNRMVRKRKSKSVGPFSC